VAIGPARFPRADLIHVQLPSKVMEGWPYCGSGGYRKWLTWAEDSGFTRMVLDYRHSQDPQLSRARTFEFEAELDGLSGVEVNSRALLRAAEETNRPGRPAAHPRQVEHALYAQRLHGHALAEAFGPREGDLIGGLLLAYQAAVGPEVSADGVPGAREQSTGSWLCYRDG
jgi:hypothetical protein